MHPKKRDLSVRRGEKRRNTGVVFQAFSTKLDGKISFFRLPDPYLACPNRGGFLFPGALFLLSDENSSELFTNR